MHLTLSLTEVIGVLQADIAASGLAKSVDTYPLTVRCSTGASRNWGCTSEFNMQIVDAAGFIYSPRAPDAVV